MSGKMRNNLVNKRFHRLVVIRYEGKIGQQAGLWRCKCDCGKETLIPTYRLLRGLTKSCGCLRLDYNSKVGQKKGRLLIIRKVGKKERQCLYECRCDCGKIIIKTGHYLSNPKYKSCGCLRKEIGTAPLKPGEASFNDLFEDYKRNAKCKKRKFDLSKKEFKHLTSQDCYYCGQSPANVSKISKNGEYIYNGVDRIDSSKGYISGNCLPCCSICNLAKSNMPFDEFIRWIERLIHHKRGAKLDFAIRSSDSSGHPKR